MQAKQKMKISNCKNSWKVFKMNYKSKKRSIWSKFNFFVMTRRPLWSKAFLSSPHLQISYLSRAGFLSKEATRIFWSQRRQGACKRKKSTWKYRKLRYRRRPPPATIQLTGLKFCRNRALMNKMTHWKVSVLRIASIDQRSKKEISHLLFYISNRRKNLLLKTLSSPEFTLLAAWNLNNLLRHYCRVAQIHSIWTQRTSKKSWFSTYVR